MRHMAIMPFQMFPLLMVFGFCGLKWGSGMNDHFALGDFRPDTIFQS
jgi:hypothetical protein